MRDCKVTGSFKGHFVHAFLLGKQNGFHFIPYYIIIIIIQRKCSSGVERLMTFSGPTYPLFSFAMLFDSVRRDWNEEQWNDRGKSPHAKFRWSLAPTESPAHHVFLTSGFKAAIYLCPLPQPVGRVSEERERDIERVYPHPDFNGRKEQDKGQLDENQALVSRLVSAWGFCSRWWRFRAGLGFLPMWRRDWAQEERKRDSYLQSFLALDVIIIAL